MHKFPKIDAAFFLHSVSEMEEENRRMEMNPRDFNLVNPNTGTSPIFRAQRDYNITMGIYRNDEISVMRKDGESPAWAVAHYAMLHMTADSGNFRKAEDLKQDGYYCVAGNVYKRGEERALPLYVGKMIRHFNHRASSVMVNLENIHNAALPQRLNPDQLQNPNFLPIPQYWVNEEAVDQRLRRFPEGLAWMIGFRGISRAVDTRTITAAIIPRSAVGNQLPLLLPDVPPRPDEDEEEALKKWREQCALALEKYRAEAPLYLANLCSFALDYVCRQKMQSTALNWYIVEQLPVILVSAYGRKFGKKTAKEIVREHVLRLTYTAEDMRPFARDMGCKGNPFKWDEEERAHLRARLDALYFHLYGIGAEDAEYILSTFKIVEAKDRKAHGSFRTRDLILAYMSALQQGDVDICVTP